MEAKTFKASEIEFGYHPDGYRIDKTASAMDRYTKWEIDESNEWWNPRPVCFHSLPETGWLKVDAFDWSADQKG